MNEYKTSQAQGAAASARNTKLEDQANAHGATAFELALKESHGDVNVANRARREAILGFLNNGKAADTEKL